MAAPQFSNPFAPLDLTREAKNELRELAEMFVADAMGHYECYLQRDHRQVDPTQWKFIRQKEDVRVYRERSKKTNSKRHQEPTAATMAKVSHNNLEHLDSTSSVSDNDDLSQYDYTDEAPSPPPSASASSLPVLLTVGTLVGDLYDTMYGVVNPTLDMMRIKTSYVEDVVVNAAVLATLHEPSLHDPFQSLTVKWAIKGQPLHIRTLVKNRDMVFLESTGLTRLPSTGETIGFQLLHSVTFPQTTPLKDSLRGNISICALYRQHGDGLVDIYAKGFLDPTGRIMKALVIKSAAEVMVSVNRNIVCAQHKKLAYALRRRHNPVLINSPYDERLQLRNQHKQNSHATGGQPQKQQCAVCSKGLSVFGPLTFGLKSHGVQCRLCLQTVCSTCRIKKKLTSISPQDQFLHQQQINFCVLCVTAVTQANALDIACDEVTQKDAPHGYGGSTTSSLSSNGDEQQHQQEENQSERRW